jgi:hypothetical protein
MLSRVALVAVDRVVLVLSPRFQAVTAPMAL